MLTRRGDKSDFAAWFPELDLHVGSRWDRWELAWQVDLAQPDSQSRQNR